MIHLASDFRKLTKLAEIYHRIAHTKNDFLYSMSHWENNKQLIDATLNKMQSSAEQGSTRLYLSKDDPFWVSPQIHNFFIQSGFKIEGNSIHWNEELR